MEIKDLIAMQIESDIRNDFPVYFDDISEKYLQITKDLVGLVGEIGEFSNIIKKINIKLEKNESYQLDFEQAESSLKEELVDSLIYLVRIAAIIDIDIEKEYLRKLHINNTRFNPK